MWMRLISENGGVPRPYWGKLAKILAISAFMSPMRLAESMRFGRSKLARVEIDKAPIYIQGFARSGTTHLHNLLSQDPIYGVVTTFQAMAASIFLVGRGKLDRLVANRMPKTRPMDNMVIDLSLPQEEEVALANTSHLSAVHLLSFPQRAKAILEKFSTMQLSHADFVEWEREYLNVLRKATIASEGRRLLLKSPTNLGRTHVLQRLFPDAKFIHIMRNPYVVFQSMTHLYRTMLPICQLEDANANEVEAAIRNSYVAMMQQFMKDREFIPEGNFAEVRFEDLEKEPVKEIARLYDELDLPDWEQAKPNIEKYVDSLGEYKKNTYQIDTETIEFVDREWGFAVEEWGYKPPLDGAV